MVIKIIRGNHFSIKGLCDLDRDLDTLHSDPKSARVHPLVMANQNEKYKDFMNNGF